MNETDKENKEIKNTTMITKGEKKIYSLRKNKKGKKNKGKITITKERSYKEIE